jgi:hypothetical protein
MAWDAYRKKERVGWVGVNTLQREMFHRHVENSQEGVENFRK